MHIQLGYELIYDLPQDTPMILLLNIHPSRAADLVIPDFVVTDPPVPITEYRDGFGNACTRIVAPRGRFRIETSALIRDSGKLDEFSPASGQHPVEDLPNETLEFLLGSRYCETDVLSQSAWNIFGLTRPGWERVQAICDYVHNWIAFDYQRARATRTAAEAFNERVGVCRDYAHLAITFCRCMNIPARYCTGYLGDIGMPPPYAVGDFAAWMEVYLGGRWHIFDPRNNARRIGRVLIGRGRDAADVAIATTFGLNWLEGFKVWSDEAAESPLQRNSTGAPNAVLQSL
jgi:transglutaminase-like putative cysteine protease